MTGANARTRRDLRTPPRGYPDPILSCCAVDLCRRLGPHLAGDHPAHGSSGWAGRVVLESRVKQPPSPKVPVGMEVSVKRM
jgi:hypothetical protein